MSSSCLLLVNLLLMKAVPSLIFTASDLSKSEMIALNVLTIFSGVAYCPLVPNLATENLVVAIYSAIISKPLFEICIHFISLNCIVYYNNIIYT